MKQSAQRCVVAGDLWISTRVRALQGFGCGSEGCGEIGNSPDAGDGEWQQICSSGLPEMFARAFELAGGLGF